MKKIFILLTLLSFLPLITPLEITREFSSNNIEIDEAIFVKLIIKVNPNDAVYVIEENVPNNLVILDTKQGSYAKGKMLWVIQDNIEDTELSYTIKGINGGDYNFNGVSSVNGEPEQTISGDNILTINGPLGPLCGNGNCDTEEDCSTCSSDCGGCSNNQGSSSEGGGISSNNQGSSSNQDTTSKNITLDSSNNGVNNSWILRIKKETAEAFKNSKTLIILLLLIIIILIISIILIYSKFYKK